MKEIWKDIKGYEELYQVSNLGKVKSVRFNKVLVPIHNKNGYLYVNLYKNKKAAKKYIHRLVAETFIDNQNKYLVVNHIDGNKQNNNVSNIEFCTRSENQLHAYRIGLQIKDCKIFHKTCYIIVL